jgi:Winged helix DNA-binding domain
MRLRGQRLLPGSEAAGPVEAAAAVCGLQAQDAPAAALSVRARTSGLTAADVARAREERTLVRTWAMRGTLHLLPAGDVDWLVPLVAPPVLPMQRSWFERRGYDIDHERLQDEVVTVLEREGPLTRDELAERIERPGEGELAAAMARLASQEGLVCLGPERGAAPTYVGVRRWLRKRRRSLPADPLAELARRYLAGHGPAAPDDLAAWSGLGMRLARDAFELVKDELQEVRYGGAVLWALASSLSVPEAERFVRLLPRWDSALLGWKSRDLLVPPAHAKKVLPGGGYLHAVVLVDGRAAGTWRIDRGQVRVDWFEREPRGLKRALAAEEEDVVRFSADS